MSRQRLTIGAGDELRARLVDRLGDLNVVSSRPSQTVVLVHDDVVDLMIFQVRKHPLEFRAVGVAPRLAAVNKLGGDERPQPYACRWFASRWAGMEKPSHAPPPSA